MVRLDVSGEKRRQKRDPFLGLFKRRHNRYGMILAILPLPISPGSWVGQHLTLGGKRCDKPIIAGV